MCKVIALSNQKGGVGKTNVCTNLGIGLAKHGQKVLLIDCDSQCNLSISLGVPKTSPVTVMTMLMKVLTEESFEYSEGIQHHAEGVDLMPASEKLDDLNLTLVSAMARESILRQYVDELRPYYDFILLDTSPSLGLLTINALMAADSVLVPVQTQMLAVRGLEQLLQTVSQIRRRFSHRLAIEGVLLTMVDSRTTNARDIIELLNNSYGDKLNIYDMYIPFSVRAAETSLLGKSIYAHDPHGKVAAAYELLTLEVLSHGKA